MAIMTRWRMPPGQLVGVLAQAGARLGDPDLREQVDGAACGRPAGNAQVVAHGCDHLRPTVRTGFSDVMGSWKTMAICGPHRWRFFAGDSERMSVPWKMSLLSGGTTALRGAAP